MKNLHLLAVCLAIMPAVVLAADQKPATPTPPLLTDKMWSRVAPDIYFDFGRSTLRPQSQRELQKIAQTLSQYPGLMVQIEGYCDPREGKGSGESKRLLGDERAAAAKQVLLQNGVGADTLGTISYGSTRPICTEATESCFQRNRRVHVALARL